MNCDYLITIEHTLTFGFVVLAVIWKVAQDVRMYYTDYRHDREQNDDK